MTCETRCCHGYCAGWPFLGRLLLSVIFILAGFSKLFIFHEAVGALRDAGVQSGAPAYITIALLMEIIGGLLILLGLFTRVGCWILMVFLLPTTLIFHAFWNFEGHEHALQMANFLKNLGLYGGLILLAVYGPGRWSIDARICKSCKTDCQRTDRP